MLNNWHLFRLKKLIIFYAIVDKHYKTIPLSFEKSELKFLGTFDGTIPYSYHILPSVVLLIMHFVWPRAFDNYKITQRRPILQYSFSHFFLHMEMVLAFPVCSNHINDLTAFFIERYTCKIFLVNKGYHECDSINATVKPILLLLNGHKVNFNIFPLESCYTAYLVFQIRLI